MKWKEINKNYKYKKKKVLLNLVHYHDKTGNLDDYINDIKAIETKDKERTWGREYIKIPKRVLAKFGIISNKPLVIYRNYIYGKAYNFCYFGKIFNGDAAWFDEYKKLSKKDIKDSLSYKHAKAALENTSKSIDFFSFFDNHEDKWKTVPIGNPELAEIAKQYNNHIK